MNTMLFLSNIPLEPFLMARQFALVTETLINNNLNDTVISQSTKLSSKVLFTTYSHFFTQVFNKKTTTIGHCRKYLCLLFWQRSEVSAFFSPKKVFLTNSNFYTSKIRLFLVKLSIKRKISLETLPWSWGLSVIGQWIVNIMLRTMKMKLILGVICGKVDVFLIGLMTTTVLVFLAITMTVSMKWKADEQTGCALSSKTSCFPFTLHKNHNRLHCIWATVPQCT